MLPILMYHQVTAGPPAAYSRFTVTPAAFARQMRVLAAFGIETITLDALAAALSAGAPLPSRRVVITFDDGFSDAVRHAAPVLARYRFTATFFVVAGLIGGTSEWTRRRRGVEMRLADAGALREIAAAGCTIGSHTITHRRLTELTSSECRYELRESKRRLEDVIGREVRHLSYPFGAAGDRGRVAAHECGYATASSTRESLTTSADDPLMLPRVDVSGGASLPGFVFRLRRGRGFGDVVQRVRERMNVSALAR